MSTPGVCKCACSCTNNLNCKSNDIQVENSSICSKQYCVNSLPTCQNSTLVDSTFVSFNPISTDIYIAIGLVSAAVILAIIFAFYYFKRYGTKEDIETKRSQKKSSRSSVGYQKKSAQIIIAEAVPDSNILDSIMKESDYSANIKKIEIATPESIVSSQHPGKINLQITIPSSFNNPVILSPIGETNSPIADKKGSGIQNGGNDLAPKPIEVLKQQSASLRDSRKGRSSIKFRESIQDKMKTSLPGSTRGSVNAIHLSGNVTQRSAISINSTHSKSSMPSKSSMSRSLVSLHDSSSIGSSKKDDQGRARSFPRAQSDIFVKRSSVDKIPPLPNKSKGSSISMFKFVDESHVSKLDDDEDSDED